MATGSPATLPAPNPSREQIISILQKLAKDIGEHFGDTAFIRAAQSAARDEIGPWVDRVGPWKFVWTTGCGLRTCPAEIVALFAQHPEDGYIDDPGTTTRILEIVWKSRGWRSDMSDVIFGDISFSFSPAGAFQSWGHIPPTSVTVTSIYDLDRRLWADAHGLSTLDLRYRKDRNVNYSRLLHEIRGWA
jgi:hypothetical protein